MATATDNDTVTLGPDEIQSLGHVADRLRDTPTHDEFDAAADRLRSQKQLTFDVGKAGGSPDFATLKIAGDFGIGRDLKRRADVHVTVTDTWGEVLVERDLVVTSVQFKDKTDQHGNVTTERIHVATLGG